MFNLSKFCLFRIDTELYIRFNEEKEPHEWGSSESGMAAFRRQLLTRFRSCYAN